MAEPTLKDVLKAISELATKDDVEAVRGDVEAVRGDVEALRRDVAKLEERIEAKIDKLDERIEALDAKVDTFRDVLSSHRQDTRGQEADIVAIHKSLVRAKVPGIPKDLPSQVRAKGERPSKPAKRAARRR
jgi:polyhydroxyalkanoate synthesis regulator phasin